MKDWKVKLLWGGWMAIGAVLIGLKMLGVVNIPWWAAAAPLLAELGVLLLFAAILLVSDLVEFR